jgi:fatty-acid desaturase
MPDDLPVPGAATASDRLLHDADSVQAWRIDWLKMSAVIGYHLVASLALFSWFFTWTGVVLALLGIYFFGMLGINLCFHRLLTHRSFSCPRWLEYVLTVLGVCSVQDSPANWVAAHRQHHQFSDHERDPHSPTGNFLWGHVGWLVIKDSEIKSIRLQRYAKDMLRDPFHAWLQNNWLLVVVASWIVFFTVGVTAGMLLGMTPPDIAQFAVSLFVWGVAMRTVVFWQLTWSVNSVSHLWGYRNYETREGSRNNLVIGLLSFEWHNNHHANPNSALFGHRWWEADPVFWIIRLFAALGLAKDIVMPAQYRR